MDKTTSKTKTAEKPAKEKEKQVEKKGSTSAVVRVRGKVHVRKDIADTLKLLNLTRVNHCTVIDNRPEYKGMINKAKDYITWGEITPETLKKLITKRGRLKGDLRITDEYIKKNSGFNSVDNFIGAISENKTGLKGLNGMKPVFRLRPPKKGYERAGIKQPFSLGGALGYRGEKINALLERMI
jgi:large subunit ribosomal protein L30